MGILENVRNWLLSPILEQQQQTAQAREIQTVRSYREGIQKRQLKTRPGKPDDNLIDNKISLIVDRQISLLFGNGIEFQFEEGAEAEKEYLDAVWDVNKQEKLLHQLGEDGAIAGTCYVKIIPDGIVNGDGVALPRLIALDPASMTIHTDPEDWEKTLAYVCQYSVRKDNKLVLHRQSIVKADDGLSWTITDEEENHGKFVMVGEVVTWLYSFAPVFHWQNLPARSPYGRADITQDLIDLQDHYNFSISNRSKILRNHAHPKTIATGVNKTQIAEGQIETGPDDMFCIPTGATIENLEMSTDLVAAATFARELRQAIFDNTRTVDLDSLQDKLGSLTNFGLRVLYQDTLAKIATKQELYGDALEELNHRLLILSGHSNTDGGEVKWPEVLPVNQAEETQAIQADLASGLVSKETASTKRGYTWLDEEEKIANDKASESNIGAVLMKSFNRGGGNGSA